MKMLTPNFFVIAVFLVILAVPPFLQIAVEAGRGERPAALWIFSQEPTQRNLRAYEKSLQDASVTVQTLRPVMQAFQFFALREAGEKAIIGRDGWLFYQPGIRFLTQHARPGDPALKDVLAAVTQFRDDLAARGIRLIVMPVPNKESVYPDKLSACAVPPGQPIGRETREFLAQCRERGIEVVDLFALYRDARKTPGAPLYLEQDSHWTPVGMELATNAVAARIFERGWLMPGSIAYYERSAPVEETGDLVRMLRSPQIEARLAFQTIATKQVVCSDTGALYSDDPEPEVLVLGDSFLRIYQRNAPGGAGFVAHLAFALKRATAGIINDGGASTLVRQELFRRPQLLSRARVVVWEFVERDLRLGTEGWQILPLSPESVEQSRSRRAWQRE